MLSSSRSIDYRKAFDSVPHAPLMRKLQDMELPTDLLAWISDYLTFRKQQVIVDGTTSSQCSVASGVPQGSRGAGTFALFNLLLKLAFQQTLTVFSMLTMFCCTVGYRYQRKIFTWCSQITTRCKSGLKNSYCR